VNASWANTRSRGLRRVVAIVAGIVVACAVAGCTADPGPSDPTATGPAPTTAAPTPGTPTSGSGTPTQSAAVSPGDDTTTATDNPVDPVDPATDPNADPGEMEMPNVQPAPAGDEFCQVYIDYVNAGGPYSIQESGDQLPPFTQADLDALVTLQSLAPAEVRAQLDLMVQYGREMFQGDFTHGIEYDNLVSGPGGITLWAIPYCNMDDMFA
jgi:hypothetical protein